MEKISINPGDITDEQRKVMLEAARYLKGCLEHLGKSTTYMQHAVGKSEMLPYLSLSESLSQAMGEANDMYLKLEDAWRLLLKLGHNEII